MNRYSFAILYLVKTELPLVNTIVPFRRLLAHTLAIYRDNFYLFAPIIVFIYLPLNTIFELLTVRQPTGAEQTWDVLQKALQISQVLEMFWGIFGTMALIYTVKVVITNTKSNVVDILVHVFSLGIKGIATNLLMTILLIGLTVMLVIPGLIYLVYWQFALTAVVLGGVSLNAALKYSKLLVKGRWWKTAQYSFWIMTITLFATMIYSTIVIKGDNLIINIANDTILNFIAAFGTIAATLLFLNLEITRVPTTNQE